MTSLLNTPVPSFSLQDQDGNMHTPEQYKGKYLLLYFYPKDMTPGCTTEACTFRDTMNNLKESDVQVLGVSADSVESHKKFAQKYQLNFPLLADTEKTLIQALGIWKEKTLFGKIGLGISRDSFLVNPEGMVVKHYEKVDPQEHPAEVLADVQALKA